MKSQCMRIYNTFLSIVIVATLLLAPIEVNAQESIQLRVYPQSLKIAGTKGQKITRILTITANRAIDPQALQISFRDLYRTDEWAIFPIKAQKANSQAAQISKFEYQLPLEFDLGQSYSMGEFSGQIVLRYEQPGENSPEEIILPITTKIKSNWFLPLLIIFIGTGIGTGLSWYRAKGRPRDQILVRVGRLRLWIEKDPQFAKSRGFKSQVDYQLNNVRSAIQEERWENAESALTLAKTIWQKWNKGKTLLLPQLEYADELEKKVAEIDPNQPFKQQILYKIAKQGEQAPELDNIEQLRINLCEIASKIKIYNQLQNQWEQIENLWYELSQVYPEGAKQWKSKLENRQEHFCNLTLDEDLDNLLAELKNIALEINEAIPRGRGSSIKESLATVPDKLILEDAPTGIAFDLKQSFSQANLNLKIFAWLSYIVALILLVGAGFNEIYLKQETFGERPFADYFSLLAWGFGAEASRDAIAKTVEGWGLARLDKE